MDLGVSERVKPLIEAVRRMVQDEIAPLDSEFHAEVGKHPSGDRFQHTDRSSRFSIRSKQRQRHVAFGISG